MQEVVTPVEWESVAGQHTDDTGAVALSAVVCHMLKIGMLWKHVADIQMKEVGRLE